MNSGGLWRLFSLKYGALPEAEIMPRNLFRTGD
ncbi:hypothetical protein J2793_002976 [Paraburkholderia caledonica]|jgi:hypothetical protein|uniref:Uncharacterized protein n=1 Tax=Paraburkholderia caledonica TaxID=134536 RepID=A0AB73IBW6_9BURK|nr:hypothetical protein [Paraburkholderia caledonica]